MDKAITSADNASKLSLEYSVPDREGVGQVAHKVINHGEGKIRPRARLIRTIGAELISSEIVAVIELVRNCYDADATTVILRFNQPHDAEHASLDIVDNGHGMTREILLGPWLEPATDYKSGASEGQFAGMRSPMGRRRLGSKGVGRFAAQRLGQYLTMESTTRGAATRLEAVFDWEALDTPERYLDQLRIPWKEFSGAEASRSGTRLHIKGLRDQWTAERFGKLRLALSRLIGPGLGQHKFKIELVVDGVVQEIQPAIDMLEPMYTLSGHVHQDGMCQLTYRDISGALENWERTVFWPDVEEVCGPFHFEIKAWDLDKDALQYFLSKSRRKLGLRNFRRLIRDHSGISLYRDGFRILPYGEPDNDWLRLDRRRVNNPTMRLSNNQIMGRVELAADDNPGLKDQTNREGLVTNDAYQHLQTVVLELMSYLESRRFSARRSMSIGAERYSTALPVLEDQSDAIVERLLDRLTGDGNRASTVKELRGVIDERRAAVTNHLNHYAGLAANGQMAGLVFKQIDHPTRQLQSELRILRQELRDVIEEPEDLETVHSSVEKLERCVAEIQTRLEKLNPLASLRRGRRRIKTDLSQCLRDAAYVFSEQMVLAEVDFHFDERHQPELSTDPSVAQQVVAVLMDNALHWIKTGPRGNRVLTLRVMQDGFIFKDTGPGIPKEARPHIFEPWFSLREDGAGMGLTLARDLLRSIGGDIQLMRTGKDHGASFRISLT